MEKLKAELTEKMKQVPGYVPALLQPIENRILMLYTGIRAQVGVKIYGDNLDDIQRKAFEIEKLINSIDGAAGVSPSRVQGKPYLNIEVDRTAMARYGLSAKDVLDAVEISIGGKNVSTTIEGRQRFPIQIRVERGERDDIEKLSRILIAAKPGMASANAAPQGGGGMGGGMGGGAAPAATPAGGGDGAYTPYIPLGMVAKITRQVGANEIASENGRLRSYVQANVQDRDLGGFVQEVEQKLKTVNWEGI
jgi:Cu(I)/Ag(I) efflux system membrane protein CusA/SilA